MSEEQGIMDSFVYIKYYAEINESKSSTQPTRDRAKDYKSVSATPFSSSLTS